MSTALPISPVVGIDGTDEVHDLSAVYTTLVDELAGMIEADPVTHTVTGRIVLDALGALHTALDELTLYVPDRQRLARLAADTHELAVYADEYRDLSRAVRATVAPLRELCGALHAAVRSTHYRSEGGV